MPKSPQIIAMSAPVTIEAAAADGAQKGPRKFEVLAYTGGLLPGALKSGDSFEDVVVDLSGMQHGKSLVANLDHDGKQRVGNVTAIENDGKQLVLSGTASAATPARNEVIESASDGFNWQASIEARPTKLEIVKAGKKVTVNGQEFAGPLVVARQSVLKGFAFVSHGADDNTTVTIAASADSQKEKSMDPKIKSWAESMGIDVDNATEQQVAVIEANFAGRTVKPTKANKLEDVIAAERAEQSRKEEIANITAQAIADNPGRGDDFITKLEVLANQAIEAKWEASKYELEILRASRPQAHTTFTPRSRESGVSPKVLEAAICMSGNLPNIEKKFGDEVLQAAHDKFRGRIGLKQLYRIAARANGFYSDSDDVTKDMQRAAFGLGNSRSSIQAGQQWSTLPLPGILSNSANKFLLEGWGAGEMTWRAITSTRSVGDFKTATSYKLSGNLKYAKVGPGGEITHGTVSEDTYTNKADTYGRMFAVTRTDIINDDLGALTQVPLELGIAANDSLNEVFWTEFLNNGSFFAGGNNNVSTGAFSLAALAAAEVVFMAQTKPNGTPLGVMPSMILVPNGTYRAALAAMESAFVVGTTGPTADVNTFKGNYAVHTSAYMANSAYTGYSTVKWYMLARRPGLSVIETAFLNGREAPVVETDDADFNVLGIQMRAYHDFGCNLQEYRAGVQGSGA